MIGHQLLWRSINVRFTPKSGHVQCSSRSPLWAKSGRLRLFDHLVGYRLNLPRNRDAEHLGGLEVDHEIKSGWLFYWQVSGLAALLFFFNEKIGPPVKTEDVHALANST